MALTKDKKHEIVRDMTEALAASKMTVVAKYSGTTVKAMQQLRRDAASSDTSLRVVKNRLVKRALGDVPALKDVDTSQLVGQLLYAFNPSDEVAPAQALASFAKQNPNLQFVGAITSDGKFLEASDVQALANLPTKQQLRGQLVGVLAAPLSGFMNVMSGNLRGVLYALNSRAETIK